MKIESWTHKDAVFEGFESIGSARKVPRVRILSVHALNQFVGWVKYSHRSTNKVYFRGQTGIYSKMLPSLYRESLPSSSLGNLNNSVSKYLANAKKQMPLVRSLPDYTIEPMFQHYGLKTRWIDLVDNLWVALWFGVHHYKHSTQDRHYEFVWRSNTLLDYAYLFLMKSDGLVEAPGMPGLFLGKDSQVIDLRVSCPSIFLRPHAQHAILMRPNKCDTVADADLAKSIVAIAKIRVGDVLEWLGDGRMARAENIYPSPVFDAGYRILLEQAPHSKPRMRQFGSITHMSYEGC